MQVVWDNPAALLDSDLVVPPRRVTTRGSDGQWCFAVAGSTRAVVFRLLQGGRSEPAPEQNKPSFVQLNAQILDGQGCHELKQGRIASAYLFFTQAYRLMPSPERAQVLLNISVEELRAITNPQVLVTLLGCFRDAGKSWRMVCMVETLYAQGWRSADAIYWLANYYRQQGDSVQAIKWFTALRTEQGLLEHSSRADTIEALLASLWQGRKVS